MLHKPLFSTSMLLCDQWKTNATKVKTKHTTVRPRCAANKLRLCILKQLLNRQSKPLQDQRESKLLRSRPRLRSERSPGAIMFAYSTITKLQLVKHKKLCIRNPLQLACWSPQCIEPTQNIMHKHSTKPFHQCLATKLQRGISMPCQNRQTGAKTIRRLFRRRARHQHGTDSSS